MRCTGCGAIFVGSSREVPARLVKEGRAAVPSGIPAEGLHIRHAPRTARAPRWPVALLAAGVPGVIIVVILLAFYGSDRPSPRQEGKLQQAPPTERTETSDLPRRTQTDVLPARTTPAPDESVDAADAGDLDEAPVSEVAAAPTHLAVPPVDGGRDLFGANKGRIEFMDAGKYTPPGGDVYFAGRIRNRTDQTIEMVRIAVDAYDTQDGKRRLVDSKATEAYFLPGRRDVPFHVELPGAKGLSVDCVTRISQLKWADARTVAVWIDPTTCPRDHGKRGFVTLTVPFRNTTGADLQNVRVYAEFANPRNLLAPDATPACQAATMIPNGAEVVLGPLEFSVSMPTVYKEITLRVVAERAN